jgi:hypothetical protein
MGADASGWLALLWGGAAVHDGAHLD